MGQTKIVDGFWTPKRFSVSAVSCINPRAFFAGEIKSRLSAIENRQRLVLTYVQVGKAGAVIVRH